MSNIVLNFSPQGTYTHTINTALPSRTITTAEEAFARIFHDVELLALPIYHAIVHAIVARARGDLPACLAHTRRVTAQLRPLLSAYYDRVHDSTIARAAWLSHVQGFYAWGLGDEQQQQQQQEEGTVVKFDGLSGNQVLLFMVLDAFLGLEAYLDGENQRRNVPERQRRFVRAVERGAFRGRLGREGVEGEIKAEMGEVVKRLRVCFIFSFWWLSCAPQTNTSLSSSERHTGPGPRSICHSPPRRDFP
jgi:hypothetical protein